MIVFIMHDTVAVEVSPDVKPIRILYPYTEFKTKPNDSGEDSIVPTTEEDDEHIEFQATDRVVKSKNKDFNRSKFLFSLWSIIDLDDSENYSKVHMNGDVTITYGYSRGRPETYMTIYFYNIGFEVEDTGEIKSVPVYVNGVTVMYKDKCVYDLFSDEDSKKLFADFVSICNENATEGLFMLMELEQ